MTRKEYREYLNESDSGKNWKNYNYGQRTRKYGDYLWHQDRDAFEYCYKQYLEEHNLIEK